MPLTVGGAVIGHAVTLSRTNSGGVVWLCECGAIGDVTPMIAAAEEVTARSKRRLEITESIALGSHAGHLHDVRADIARRSEEVLTSVPRLVTAANSSLQRRGRWGNP